MDFNRNARLDTGEIEDRRGQGGGGGVLGALPGGLVTAGGGGLGVVVVIVYVLVQVLGGGAGTSSTAPSGSAQVGTCRTGADAAGRTDCRVTAIANSVQDFWTTDLPREKHVRYTEADTVLFTSSTSSGCGQATSDMGPFYCPTDAKVYLDVSFFQDMLQNRLGAEGGPFAEAYVIAHEYGHHVQDLLGTMAKAQALGAKGAKSGSVRLELQADCFAGIWGKHATTTPGTDGQPLITNLTTDDIHRAIDAAAAVGDDRIEKETSGQVTPEAWTHGSAAERQKWFMAGYDGGTIASCDTFAATAI